MVDDRDLPFPKDVLLALRGCRVAGCRSLLDVPPPLTYTQSKTAGMAQGEDGWRDAYEGNVRSCGQKPTNWLND